MKKILIVLLLGIFVSNAWADESVDEVDDVQPSRWRIDAISLYVGIISGVDV